jgi:hypothetical protein
LKKKLAMLYNLIRLVHGPFNQVERVILILSNFRLLEFYKKPRPNVLSKYLSKYFLSNTGCLYGA